MRLGGLHNYSELKNISSLQEIVHLMDVPKSYIKYSSDFAMTTSTIKKLEINKFQVFLLYNSYSS